MVQIQSNTSLPEQSTACIFHMKGKMHFLPQLAEARHDHLNFSGLIDRVDIALCIDQPEQKKKTIQSAVRTEEPSSSE